MKRPENSVDLDRLVYILGIARLTNVDTPLFGASRKFEDIQPILISNMSKIEYFNSVEAYFLTNSENVYNQMMSLKDYNVLENKYNDWYLFETFADALIYIYRNKYSVAHNMAEKYDAVA